LTHSATLLRDRPRPLQLVLAGVVPAVFGAITGVVLGASALAYIALNVVGALGGWLSGFEHRDGWGGADRGFAAGFIFGTFVLLAHWAAGTHAKVSLGSFPPLFAVITALIGMLITASSGRLARIERDRLARIERERLRDEQRAIGRLGVVTVNQPVDG
jgi:hypothetical protein